MTSRDLSVNRPKKMPSQANQSQNAKKKKELAAYTQKDRQGLSQHANKSVLARKASEISNINNADDFSRWLSNEYNLSTEKAQKLSAPENIKRLQKKSVIMKVVSALICIATLALIISANVAFAILIGGLGTLALLGLLTLMIPIPVTGIVVSVCLFDSAFQHGKAEQHALESMFSELMNSMIEEIFKDKRFKDMTSEEFRALAKKISIAVTQHKYTKHSSLLASELIDSLSGINLDDDKNKNLRKITDKANEFMAIVFDKIDKHIKDKETKDNLAAVKKELYAQKNDAANINVPLNNFVSRLHDFIENYNKTHKKKKNHIQLEPREIEDAIQTGFNSYFTSKV